MDVTQNFYNKEKQDFDRIPFEDWGYDHFLILEYIVERALTHSGKLPATYFLRHGDMLTALKSGDFVRGYGVSDRIHDLKNEGLVREIEFSNGTHYAPTEKGLQIYLNVVRNVIRAWETRQPVSDAYRYVEPIHVPVVPERRTITKRVGPVAVQPDTTITWPKSDWANSDNPLDKVNKE